MKRLKRLIPVFVCLVLVGDVLAQQKPKKNPCDDENAVAKMTQTEMNDCAAQDYKKADAELNKVYNQLMGKLEGEHKGKLKTAQLAWLKYRDSNCDCETFLNQGGSMYPLVYNGCMAAMTRNRTKEMKDLLEQVGN